jgi:hypothetical protein
MMKKLLSRLMTIYLVLILGTALIASPAMAATPQEIQESIDAGLPWLASQQLTDGSWDSLVGPTGLAVLKFETHAMFMGKSPLDPSYIYAANVQKGLDYIFSKAIVYAIGPQPAGDPDTNGNGIGIGAWNYGEPMYECGIATMAVSASGAPDTLTTTGPVNVIGRPYKDVAQDMVDFIAFAQNEGSGGWTYQPNGSGGDNSVSGYVTLGLSYAEASPPYGFDLTIPGFVRTELNAWINYIQTSGGPDDGGSGYSAPGYWVNILKTGHLLAQMALVGDTQATPRVQRAVAYIARHWNDANYDPGWRNSYQTCFTTMKGFQSLGIKLIDVDGDLTPETDWYDEMSTMIVNTQNPDDSWPADYWWGQNLATAWAMLTLEKAAPPALSLTPLFDTNPWGTQHIVTTTYKLAGVPQQDIQINFLVTAGPNAGEGGNSTTDVNGQASFTYTGDGGVGTDTIQATAIDATGAPLVSAQATKDWTPVPVTVGGEAYPINKIVLIAPWIALAVVIAAGGIYLVRRRAHS